MWRHRHTLTSLLTLALIPIISRPSSSPACSVPARSVDPAHVILGFHISHLDLIVSYKAVNHGRASFEVMPGIKYPLHSVVFLSVSFLVA